MIWFHSFHNIHNPGFTNLILLSAQFNLHNAVQKTLAQVFIF